MTLPKHRPQMRMMAATMMAVQSMNLMQKVLLSISCVYGLIQSVEAIGLLKVFQSEHPAES